MRTYILITLLALLGFFLMERHESLGIVPERSGGDAARWEREGRPEAHMVSSKPEIILVPEGRRRLPSVVSAPLNHYTTVSVGRYKGKYAVVISTDPKGKGEPDLADGPGFSEQKFADEITDSSTMAPPPVDMPEPVFPEPVVSASERGLTIVPDETVAEGSGANPFGDGGKGALPAGKNGDEIPSDYGHPNGFFDISTINAAYLLGKFNPATHPEFTKIARQYGNKAGMYARKDTYEAFKEMHAAAKRNGVNLLILSATRSFSGQKRIWEAKWTGRRKVGGQDLASAIPFGTDRARKILEFSAMPGTSRHHWGTDLDLCALNNRYFESGEGKKIYDWLIANAHKYGFRQPYTARGTGRGTGHREERWHWSYTPVSRQLISKYSQILTNETIDGFLGQETASEVRVLEDYVLGVDEDCK